MCFLERFTELTRFFFNFTHDLSKRDNTQRTLTQNNNTKTSKKEEQNKMNSCTCNFIHVSVMMDEPRFAQPIANVTVAVGRDANLPCVVENLGSYKVSTRCVHFYLSPFGNSCYFSLFFPERFFI